MTRKAIRDAIVRCMKPNPTTDIPRLQRKNRRGYAWNARLLRRYKMMLGCTDCGFRSCSAALEYDHCRGVKSFILGRHEGHSVSEVRNEIRKCDVVCATCHRIRTYKRRSQKTRYFS